MTENEIEKKIKERICPDFLEREKKVLSPSKKFELKIENYSGEGFGASRGIVINSTTRKKVCEIVRNYNSFFYSFVQKDNQDYLVTGRSYMSQTIVNLETGEQWEPKGSQYNSGAFVWTDVWLSSDEKTLIVRGCHWACPYEYKFFDFTDPSQGWEELPVFFKGEQLHCINAANHGDPIFFRNGEILFFTQTEEFYKPLSIRENNISLSLLEEIPEHEFNNENNWDIVVDEHLKVKRFDNRIIISDIWRSPHFKKIMRKYRELKVKIDKDYENWKKTDFFYLALKERLSNHPFLYLSEDWIGSSASRTEGEKNQIFFSPSVKHKESEKKVRKSCRLKWDTVDGNSVSVKPWTFGKGTTDKIEVPKTQEGLIQAIHHIERHYEDDKAYY